MTQMLDVIFYSSMITRETVKIALTMAALHDLEVKTADLLHAYVMVPTIEIIWALLSLKFEDSAGKSTISLKSYSGYSMIVTL